MWLHMFCCSAVVGGKCSCPSRGLRAFDYHSARLACLHVIVIIKCWSAVCKNPINHLPGARFVLRGSDASHCGWDEATSLQRDGFGGITVSPLTLHKRSGVAFLCGQPGQRDIINPPSSHFWNSCNTLVVFLKNTERFSVYVPQRLRYDVMSSAPRPRGVQRARWGQIDTFVPWRVRRACNVSQST